MLSSAFSMVSLCLYFIVAVTTTTVYSASIPSLSRHNNTGRLTTTEDDGIFSMGPIDEPTEAVPSSFDKQSLPQTAATSLAMPSATFVVCNQLNVANTSELHLFGKITIINKFVGIQQPRHQATMLSKLDTRFRLAGYTNIQFAFVYPTAEHRNRSDGSGDVIPLLSAHLQHSLIVITDTSQSPDLQKLNAGATYVIDPCGRLAYIISFPWSSIQNPFVKAAILSTVYDAPCGPCHIESQHSPYSNMATVVNATTANPLSLIQSINNGTTQPEIHTNITAVTFTDNETVVENIAAQHRDLQKINLASNLTVAIANVTSRLDNFLHKNNFTDEEVSSPADEAFIIPIRVILPIEHAHAQSRTSGDDIERTYLKYNYLMLKTNDINYHEHLDTDRPERLSVIKTVSQPPDLTNNTVILTLDDPAAVLARHGVDTVTEVMQTDAENVTTDRTEESTSSNAVQPDRMFVGDGGVRYKALAKDTVPKQFDYFNLVQMRSDEDVSDLEAERNMPLKQQQPEGGYTEKSSAATAYEIEQNQLEDKHYKKIMTWIHFRL